MNSHGYYNTLPDVSAYNDALRPLMEEQRQICSRADLQVLFSQKMPCKADQSTAQQLADRSKVSAEQKVALLKWRAVIEESNAKVNEVNRQYNSKNGDAMALVVEKGTANVSRLAPDLSEGRITWGEFNKRRAENSKQSDEDMKFALQGR